MKKRVFSFSSLFLLGSLLNISQCDRLLSSNGKSKNTHATGETNKHASACHPGLHFTYENTACWTEQDPAYSTCGTGQQQSPINIVDNTTTAISNDLKAIGAISYASTSVGTWDVINNGHTVQVNFNQTKTGNTITVGGIKYKLKQFHFHSRSEHTINGGDYAMEVHFVHNDGGANGGKNAVVGIMLDDNTGKDGPFISTLLANTTALAIGIKNGGWPTEEETSHAVPGVLAFDISDVIPATGYYNYKGSLTTPPCTESVAEWIVIDPAQTKLAVSPATVANFVASIGGHKNNRPVQPLNGRKVSKAQ